jgi:lipopolysaccharide/colanic/teichoic acid biosynthesis glycosyltransferase
LLTFVQRETAPQGNSFRRLLRILKRRLRITDEIGLLDEQRLAVVLPETCARGAWKVADDVLAAYPTTLHPPLCEVYTYPSDWADLQEEDSSDAWRPEPPRPAQPMELLFVRRVPLWKRALDIVGASVGLVIGSPVLLVCAACIKLTSPGPVLFTQWRSGAGNRPFLMYKLRTMSVDAEKRKRELMALNEQDGPAFKIKNDPRVTRLGRFLRKTSIDELPQLWNVLKGDMSLVGPRPLPCNESAGCTHWQRNRLDVKPGLTCIWQVRGRCQVSFDEWVRMDLEYVRRTSLLGDLMLIVQTAAVVLRGRGAH